MNLALFDFDGTITTCDTFTPFMKFSIPKLRFYSGIVVLFPYLILYSLNLISASSMRQKVVYMGLKNLPKSYLDKMGKNFCNNFLAHQIREVALEKINHHLSVGDKVIVVSASLDTYLKPWCERMGVDLICTCLETNDKGVLTGRYFQGDCSGIEKANRIKNRVDLDSYQKIYAYGDTKEDLEMLSLAHEKYYQWQKVD